MNPVYLLKIDPNANNNKYYRMIPNGETFTVEYGRVGNETVNTKTYDIDLWDKTYSSKLRKGYIDQTHLVAEILSSSTGSNDYLPISNASIAMIVSKLQSYAGKAVEENYNISSQKVTPAMVDTAQNLLNDLAASKSVDRFNSILIELFRTIPRKMKRVSDNLAHYDSDMGTIVQREQDTLDTMRGQVIQIQTTRNDDDKNEDILSALGLEFEEITGKDETLIKSLLDEIKDKFGKAWLVTNNKTQTAFDKFVKSNKIKETKLLWHGSRNENWWNIVQTGLLLRPNAIITGKMFGNGIYFAPKARKSLGYTSITNSYWARGNSPVGYMAIYNVAYGTPYDVRDNYGSYHNFDYNSLQRERKGAHCLHAHAGSRLFNDEIVFYKEEQVTIKYLVEIK